MRAADILVHSVEALRADRRQATLSCLGIVCGVAAVVTALAIGEGARREALADVDALGIDNVIVDSPLMRLTLDDARTIARSVPAAAAIAPVRSGTVSVESAAVSLKVTAVGVTP